MTEQAALITKLNIINKLGLSRYNQIALYNTDEHSPELMDYATASYQTDKQYDALIAHAYSIAEIGDLLTKFAGNGQIRPGGQLYLVIPRPTTTVYPGIERLDIFPALNINRTDGYFPDTNFTYTAMVALNQVFAIMGFKLATAREKKIALAQLASKQRGGSAAAFDGFISEIVAKLNAEDPALAEKFQRLSAAQQSASAKEIYSARTSLNRVKNFYQLVNDLKKD